MPAPLSPGALLELDGTNIKATYTASSAIAPGRLGRIRFWVHVVLSAGSGLGLGTLTVKLQQRYNDTATQGGYLDLPSTLDDVQGAAQPKGSTFEVEHAFTLPAAPSTGADFSFYLDDPTALLDLTVNAKGSAAGQAGDTVTVFAAA